MSEARQMTLGKEYSPPAQPEQGSVALMRIIERAATDPNFDADKLGKLLDVRERWEAAEARKAYIAAFATFKKEPLRIEKNKHVRFGNTEYDHVTLDNLVAIVAPALGKHGLSHRWEIEQDEKAMIHCSCVLTHELGHSERVTMKAGADSSGSKNGIQAIGSATTYLQRYTLLAATGLAATDQDDDGAALGAGGVISEEQYTTLANRITETKADMAKFLAYFGVEGLADLPAVRFSDAMAMLNAKARKGAAS